MDVERQTLEVDIACVGFGPATGGFLGTLSRALLNEDGTLEGELTHHGATNFLGRAWRDGLTVTGSSCRSSTTTSTCSCKSGGDGSASGPTARSS